MTLKSLTYRFFLMMLIVFVHAPSESQVVTDGTLGNQTSLTGPDYQITHDLGRQVNTNLFHSFRTFNINANESATFTGPTNVENIISRVTGGSGSMIDGLLRSEIAGANFYLINPWGVMFGEHASLDVSGSFHVSTADYLRLGQDGRFDAMTPENSVLTTAPPSAFGFIDNDNSNITINKGFLKVQEGKTLSVIGGDIHLIGDATTDKDMGMKAPGGRINMISVVSSGEVVEHEKNPNLIIESTVKLGDIKIVDGAYVSVSSQGAGDVYVRGNNLFIGNTNPDFAPPYPSQISASSRGDKESGTINIKLTKDLSVNDDGGIIKENNGSQTGKEIAIEAETVSISKGGEILNYTKGLGNGTDILITADSISVDGRGRISLWTEGDKDAGNLLISGNSLAIKDEGYIGNISSASGNGGNIELTLKKMEIKDGGWIGTSVMGDGNSGSLSISATDSIVISGFKLKQYSDGSEVILNGIKSQNYGSGNAGIITIHTPELKITNGGMINGTTYADGKGSDILINVESLEINRGTENTLLTGIQTGSVQGQGVPGDIIIQASRSVLLDGNSGMFCTIASAGEYKDSGNITIESPLIKFMNSVQIEASSKYANSGNITIVTNQMELKGGLINNSVYQGQAGDTTIIANDSILLSGNTDSVWEPDRIAQLSNMTLGSGNAGRIAIQSKKVIIGEGGKIVPFSAKDATGSGGIVDIQTEYLELHNGGYISTQSFGKGIAGEIFIKAETIDISGYGSKNGHGTDKSSGIFSDANSSGQGGKIQIEASRFDIQEGGSISCESSGSGNAGDIEIDLSDAFVMKNTSIETDAIQSDGGDITIRANDLVYLEDSAITTSVQGGTGSGGNISIDPTFVVLKDSDIIANAYGGSGGNIHIVADHFIQDPSSLVSASSALGIDGQINIESPDTDISSDLAALPDNFLDATKWLPSRCVERTAKDVGRFVMTPRDGLPVIPEDWLGSPMGIDDAHQDIQAWYQKGEFTKIIESYADGKTKDGLSLIYTAYAYQMIGHYKAAAAIIEELDQRTGSASDENRAVFLNLRGDHQILYGDPEKAVKDLNEAGRLSNNRFLTTAVLNNLGNAYAALQRPQDAANAYAGVIATIGKASSHPMDRILRSRAWINRLKLTYASEDRQQLISSMTAIQQDIESLPASFDQALNLISLGELALRIQETSHDQTISEIKQVARQALTEAVRIAGQIQNFRIASYGYGYLGHLYEIEGNYAHAKTLTRKAIYRAHQIHAPEILYLWQWQMARLMTAENNPRMALMFYQDSINTVNPMRMEFSKGYRDRQSGDRFAETIRPVYLELAKQYIQQAGNVRAQESLKQARDTIEKLKSWELENFYQDECVTASQTTQKRPDQQIPRGVAVLYPILFPDDVTILVTFSDGIKPVSIPVKYGQISNKIKRLNKSLIDRESVLYDARDLYDWLIRPLEADLKQRHIDTLVVAPDDLLRLIPFSVLHDGKQFLIENYAIVTVPSMSLTDTEPVRHEHADTLLNGLSEARMGFSALPNVPNELKQVQSQTGGKILQDKDFLKDNMENEFKGHIYSTMHIATHGKFGKSLSDTYLLTYNEKLQMNDLETIIGYGKFRDQPLDLLTLSACETASGDERAALGLGGVALKAGARSALATLWVIHDESTAMLIGKFYQNLNNGMSKAKALQNAQKMLIANERYYHPAYWAPFLLIGNWE